MPPVPPSPWQAPSEQEKVAERIAEKARIFEEDMDLKCRSLPFSMRQDLINELKAKVFTLPLPQEHFVYEFYYNVHNVTKDILEVVKRDMEGQLLCAALLHHAGDLVGFLNEQKEFWIKSAVFIEDSIEKKTIEFDGLYEKRFRSLSPDAQELSLTQYKVLCQLENAEQKNKDYEFLLQKTIEFLRSTKGICKSKEIKIFREVLEERLREIENNSGPEVPPPGPENLIVKGR